MTNSNLQNHVDYIAERLNEGFSYEQDEYGEHRTEDGEATSPWEYISEALDFEFTVGSDRELRYARILVAFGGPNIWVDTRGSVDGYWWGEEAHARIAPSACDELMEAIRDYYDCTR